MPKESQYTSPRPDCPHPERWHSYDPDSAELEVSALVAAMVTALQPDFVVETGSAWGQTAQFIGKALQRNHGGELFTMDIDPDRVAATRVRCEGLPVTVSCVRSLDFLLPPWVTEDMRGFYWFDSLISLRVREFHHFRTAMTAGEIVGFHDSGPHHGLRPGLDRLAHNREIRLIHLGTPRGVTFAEVL